MFLLFLTEKRKNADGGKTREGAVITSSTDKVNESDENRHKPSKRSDQGEGEGGENNILSLGVAV